MNDDTSPSRRAGSTAGSGGGTRRPARSGTTPGTGATGDRQDAARRVEQTRGELTETVDALAAKADVTSRARETADRLRRQTTEKLGGLAQTAREKAQEQAPRIREQAAAPIAKVREATPEPARRAAAQAGQAAARRPAVLYAAAGFCLLAGIWIWRRGSR